MKRLLTRLLPLGAIGGIIIFGSIQFVPVDRTNPPVTRELTWNAPETRAIAERACFDCHSNETKWPWYAHVAPVSWRIAQHVNHGREHLNFSEWDRPNESSDEIIESVTDGEMPLPRYLLLHPEARLTSLEVQVLIEGLELTLQIDPPLDNEGEGSEGFPKKLHLVQVKK